MTQNVRTEEVKYVLEPAVINPHPQLEISKEQYGALKHAAAVLRDALIFEECYELLLGNFIDMEISMSEIGLRAKIEQWHGNAYSRIATYRQQVNRDMVNFLTTLRTYVDQVPQYFTPLSSATFEFKPLAKKSLKLNFEHVNAYCFMYHLRNYVQHSAMAVHGFDSTHTSHDESPNGWVESFIFYTDKSSLLTSMNFKSKTIDRKEFLSSFPEKIDVRRCARQAIQEIAAIHIALRESVDEHVVNARTVFESAIRDFKKRTRSKSVVGLCARRAGDKKTDTWIMLDWDNVRRQLATKNSTPPCLWNTLPHAPQPGEIIVLRQQAGQTPEQAAQTIDVTSARWRDYEEGLLSMPQGLFLLYQLRTGQHPTHQIQPKTGNDTRV